MSSNKFQCYGSRGIAFYRWTQTMTECSGRDIIRSARAHVECGKRRISSHDQSIVEIHFVPQTPDQIRHRPLNWAATYQIVVVNQEMLSPSISADHSSRTLHQIHLSNSGSTRCLIPVPHKTKSPDLTEGCYLYPPFVIN